MVVCAAAVVFASVLAVEIRRVDGSVSGGFVLLRGEAQEHSPDRRRQSVKRFY